MTEGFILKPYRVFVSGFNGLIFHARSRHMAISQCFQAYRTYEDVTFKRFLKMCRIESAEPDQRYGEVIQVGGEPAFYVSHNSQYIEFVRPWSDVILSSHPLDVLPIEARRGTPYAKVQS